MNKSRVCCNGRYTLSKVVSNVCVSLKRPRIFLPYQRLVSNHLLQCYTNREKNCLNLVTFQAKLNEMSPKMTLTARPQVIIFYSWKHKTLSQWWDAASTCLVLRTTSFSTYSVTQYQPVTNQNSFIQRDVHELTVCIYLTNQANDRQVYTDCSL